MRHVCSSSCHAVSCRVVAIRWEGCKGGLITWEMKAEIEEERAVMRRKAGAGANDMLHHLEGDDDDYDYSDEVSPARCFRLFFPTLLLQDSFSEDDYYYQPPEKRVESCVTVKVEDLRKSITSSQDLSRSVEGRASGSEVDQLLADRPGCMQISDTCIRVPVYARRSSGTDAPVLVLQFELPFKYPAVAPAILVVTAGDYVTETMRAYLVDWLLVQAASKLGRPMISGLLGLATMWAEIQQEAEDKRKQSEAEERRKQEAKEALEKEVEVKERALAAAADEAARARREAGEEEPEGPEVEEESSQDSADKERRARPTVREFFVVILVAYSLVFFFFKDQICSAQWRDSKAQVSVHQVLWRQSAHV